MVANDYYAALELTSDATLNDINTAYRARSLQWHPDVNTNPNKEMVAETFRGIGEAYAVLSDSMRRAIFDQYGMSGLKEGVANAGGGRIEGWSYNANPTQQFADFCGSASAFTQFFSGASGFMPMFPDTKVPKDSKVEPQVVNLYCTLEELHASCQKKVKVTRQQLLLNGKSTMAEDKVMSVDVQAGWREGTKITFKGQGDEAPGQATGDVVFELKEKPHPRFERRKNDLVFTATIDLASALTGTTVEVQTLDGRVLPIAVNEIVKPNTPKIVPGEGMPIVGGNGKRGDLVIQFEVQFPDMLTTAQKGQILEVLRA